jgi:hypothetical protein
LVVPEGITTIEVVVGTPEGVQLAAVFQSVLTLPFQVTPLTTVTSSTLLATAPDQSAAQLTRASRLYQVVCVRDPASYVAELLDAMSLKPEALLVVEDCHLYSSVPD